jgi:hypothetical protein
MLGFLAAVFFAIALIIQLASAHLGAHLGFNTFIAAGLICLALHLSGIGTGWGGRRR